VIGLAIAPGGSCVVDDAAPNAVAITIERNEESGRSRLISPLVTTACTTPDWAKPRISGHKISQPIAKAIESAETSAWAIVDICDRSSEDASHLLWVLAWVNAHGEATSC